MRKTVTYSKSYTLILTTYCSNNCSYCGFKNNDNGLITDSKVKKLLIFAKSTGHWEILVMSGENAGSSLTIKKQLLERGYSDYVDFASSMCKLILDHGLLPHTNIGVLKYDELERLHNVNASMGLMLEDINKELGRRIHPGKNIAERLRVIEDAGKLKIPFTSGIIMGLGETQKDRMESIKALLRLHARYNHIQEIILQNFVPNRNSKMKQTATVSIDDYNELIELISKNSDIAVQIPQNLNSCFKDLMLKGANDLGGISKGKDQINPQKTWGNIPSLKRELKSSGISLQPRLPIYSKYIKMGWYTPAIEPVLMKLLSLKIFSHNIIARN
ncbi:MAG: 7,8-didemethyl-8-hydroxy-5-deazariboflavin synthase subunit CofG [Candidatus Schekmanbacteria bacterium]|nr:7,8-didemethyl-8-hydroxy-5-deazariboflavin synthase subunit CofG [Candidatus Schekmanbacteria bacterium]